MTRIRRTLSVLLLAVLAYVVLALPTMAASTRGIVVAAAAASPVVVDPQVFNMIVGGVIGAACSYALKLAPRSWQGKPMAAGALVFAILIEGLELQVTGQLAHFSLATAADVLSALAGMNFFYAMLKDDLHLQDPPASAPTSTAPAPPASVGSPH
jgi:hypothetical protein